MKIVFQKVQGWDNIPNAEAELALRMAQAAESAGFKALATSSFTEIERFEPDVVIPMHYALPDQNSELKTVTPFLKLMGVDNPKVYSTFKAERTSTPEATQVVILERLN